LPRNWLISNQLSEGSNQRRVFHGPFNLPGRDQPS
jgi:hypothetical protein